MHQPWLSRMHKTIPQPSKSAAELQLESALEELHNTKPHCLEDEGALQALLTSADEKAELYLHFCMDPLRGLTQNAA